MGEICQLTIQARGDEIIYLGLLCLTSIIIFSLWLAMMAEGIK